MLAVLSRVPVGCGNVHLYHGNTDNVMMVSRIFDSLVC